MHHIALVFVLLCGVTRGHTNVQFFGSPDFKEQLNVPSTGISTILNEYFNGVDVSSPVANLAMVVNTEMPTDSLEGDDTTVEITDHISSQQELFKLIFGSFPICDNAGDGCFFLKEQSMFVKFTSNKEPTDFSPIQGYTNVEFTENSINVQMGSEEIVEFLYAQPTTAMIYSEMKFIDDLAQKFSEKTNDLVPDFYYIGFESVMAICSKYQTESPECRGVLEIVKQAMSKARETLQREYNEDGVIGEIIWSGNIPEFVFGEKQKASLKKIKNIGQRKLLQDDEEEELLEEEEEEENEEPMRDTVPQGDIEIFQIILWLSVVLTFITYGSIYSLAYMENKRDSLLYTRFDPLYDKKSR